MPGSSLPKAHIVAFSLKFMAWFPLRIVVLLTIYYTTDLSLVRITGGIYLQELDTNIFGVTVPTIASS